MDYVEEGDQENNQSGKAVISVTALPTTKEEAKMKLKTRAILLALLVLTALVLTTGCAGKEDPYLRNDEQGYNVSVKFDANGGFFTTNTSVITDSYKLSDLPGDGEAEIALLAPDDSRRGKEAFTAVRNGFFLAGWYTQRTGEGQSATYANQWDFEKDVYKVDKSGAYSASNPVLTLYAAWIPLPEIEIYDLNTGNAVSKFTVSPQEVDLKNIMLPQWDAQTGALQMNKFPKYDGHTWGDVYLDAERTQKLESGFLAHCAQVNYENATMTDGTMKLYVDYLPGEWYHISTAEQLRKNASVSGNYILDADLDFADQTWPTAFMHGNFTGTIVGNGHKISNATALQKNNDKVNTGLFGQLGEKANISDVTFENATLTIEGGARKVGANFGLLAGAVSEGATLENVAITGTLQIDTQAKFMTDDYVIGVLCGMGNPDIDSSGITCQVVGENAETVEITVENGQVILNP